MDPLSTSSTLLLNPTNCQPPTLRCHNFRANPEIFFILFYLEYINGRGGGDYCPYRLGEFPKLSLITSLITKLFFVFVFVFFVLSFGKIIEMSFCNEYQTEGIWQL